LVSVKNGGITKPQLASYSEPKKNEKHLSRKLKSQSTKIDTFEFNPTDNPESLI